MMRKAGILAAMFIATLLVMAFRFHGEHTHFTLKYTSGGPVGHSGDPASGENCTNCHSGVEAQMASDWIVSDIPESGYLPNTTYSITATATGSGHTKFGFQISPQNSGGTFLGTMISTDVETALTSNPNYITHTADGTGGEGAKSWTFDWTAPDPGSGDVTFYGAFNLTNNNSRSDGDTIVLSTLTVTEHEGPTGINDISAGHRGITIYPNPATGIITFVADYSMLGSAYHIIDVAGRQVMTGEITSISNTLTISHLATGVYYIHLGQEKTQAFRVE